MYVYDFRIYYIHPNAPRGFTNEFIIFKFEMIFTRKNLQLIEYLAPISVGKHPIDVLYTHDLCR